MIQLEQQQHREFWVGWWGGWGGSHTNYLYPARWGWINDIDYAETGFLARIPVFAEIPVPVDKKLD